MACVKRCQTGWGPAIVMASLMVCFIRDGFRFSFGMLVPVIMDRFRANAADTAWVASIMFSVLYFSAPICSIIVSKFGSRFSTVAGCLLCCAGLLSSAYVHKLQILYITIGILSGVGLSMMYVSQTVIVVQYFKANRSLLLGVSQCGSGLGGVVFTWTINALTKEHTWRGILLVLTGIVLQACIAGMLMRPKQYVSKQDGDNELNVGETEIIVDLLDANEKENSETQMLDTYNTTSLSENSIRDKTVVSSSHKTAVCVAEESMVAVYASLLKDIKIYLFVGMQVFLSSSILLPFTFIPLTALSMGYSENHAAWLLTSVNIASIAFRLIGGAVADRKFMNRSYMMTVSLAVLAMATFIFAFAKSYVILVILSCIIGLGTGVIITINPVVMTDIFGDKRIHAVFGLSTFGRGPGSLLVPPLAGYIYDVSGDSRNVFLVTAGTYVTATLIMICCVYIHRKQLKQ